jgi:hypothetical protein
MKDMRKRLFIVLALMVCGFAGAWADEVTPEQAREIAQTFMKSHGSRRAAPEMEQPVKVSGLYIFNINNNGGYVIVSNDDQTTPILGFSDSGSIDPDNMPSNMRAWLQGYADEIAWIQKNGITTTPATNKARRRASTHSQDLINPLLKTTWDQVEPYNNLTPYYGVSNNQYVYSKEDVSGYSHCVTGCLATAMAQVMNYHKWPQEATSSIKAYKWESADIWLPAENSDLTGTTFDWKNMANSYSGTTTEAQQTAVATLMKYCGYSVKMDYGPTSSAGLADAYYAFTNYFGYNSDKIKHYRRYMYTYSSWVDMIYNELKEGRPVLYAGRTVDEGHAFVCDGYKYDGADLFHINWGWGGQCDGDFVLSVLNPDDQGTGGSASNSAFTFGQEAIVGILKSNGSGNVQTPTAISTINISISDFSLSSGTIALGESVDATFHVKNNSTSEAFDGEICLFVNNIKTVVKMFEIAKEGEADCSITFTPDAIGEYSLGVKYPDTSGSYQDGAGNLQLVVKNQRPKNLTANNISSTTADIGWTNVGEATRWNMRSRSATATIEGFEEFSDTYDINGYTDNGWRRLKWSTDGNWRISTNGGIGGSKCFISPSYENGEDQNPYVGLMSPKFSFGGTFTFFVWGSGEKFLIYISFDGSNFTPITNIINAPDNASQYSLNLANYTGQEGYVVIVHCNSSGHTTDSYLYIDNVRFTKSVGEWNTTTGITTNTYTLTGLSAETGYEVQVQAANTNGGKWSSPVIFNTEATCPVPENITVSEVKPTSALISWTGRANASSYEVRYGKTTSSELRYDNGTCSNNIGNGSTSTWGVMYPGSQVTGSLLTKVAFYENSCNTADITVNIYSGGEDAPRTLLCTKVVAPKGNNFAGFHEIEFDLPVKIKSGNNLWITLTEADDYPIPYCTETNENNQWVCDNGYWYKIANFGWMIRGYIESENLAENTEIHSCTEPSYQLSLDGNENYYVVQVRGNYGSDGVSEWATATITKALELGNNNTNNEELIEAWNNKSTTVTLTGRKLYKDGKWNTICLPFDVTLAGSPLAGAEARSLSEVSISGTTLNLTFGNAVSTIVAGTPYIIKWPIDNDNPTIESPVFSNVTISKDMQEVSFTGGKFCGNYNYLQFGSEDTSILLIGINNKGNSALYYPQSGASLGACRACFQLDDGYTALNEGSSTIRSFVMNFGDDNSATGIIAIGDSQLSTLNSPLSGWYTLDGRKLNGKPTAKGVYVKNGKKIVIK